MHGLLLYRNVMILYIMCHNGPSPGYLLYLSEDNTVNDKTNDFAL